MRKMHYIPLLGGFFGALGVMAAVALAPYMPTQAELAPEETALLAEWSKVGDALSVQRMVEHGACVVTDRQRFLLSIGAGKFSVGNEVWFAISAQTPIYAALKGKHVGDGIVFNGQSQTIKEIF